MTTTEKANALKPGQALWVVSRGKVAVYLRCLADGWQVLTGWRINESFGSDYLSQSPVAGLEGVCHASWHADFRDLDSAVACYDRMVALARQGRPVRE